MAVTDDGVAFENVGDHRIIGEADGFWYDSYETYLAGEAAYGFRDPEFFRTPLTGEDHLLFTGNAGGVPGPYNGAVGLMTRNDDGEWDLEPPILISAGVNSQLDRPHVVLREDGLYLFFSTHDFTFSPEVYGPRGLYGFRAASGDIRGRLQPLNAHGLVAANPTNVPAQVYSYLVLPDGRVMSYLTILWGFAQRPEYSDLEMFGAGARDRVEALVYTYRSDDGETWERAGLFDTGGARMPGQYWELPMLLRIGERWMLMGTPVVEGEPARTLYWLGDFDGTRFVPDDTTPRQLDILATYRAPTLARGPGGDLIAVGIVADEFRDEQERHESGWVHVLTPATAFAPCPDDALSLCHALAPAFAARFGASLASGGETTHATLSTGGRPVVLTAEIDASAGGIVRLGTRVADDGTPAAELTIDAGTGLVRLDYRGGPVLPLARPVVFEGEIPPAGTIEMEILLDGAAVFGSLNGRPLAFLAFTRSPGRDGLRLAAEDGARIRQFRLAGHD